jgi:hypothetical protein
MAGSTSVFFFFKNNKFYLGLRLKDNAIEVFQEEREVKEIFEQDSEVKEVFEQDNEVNDIIQQDYLDESENARSRAIEREEIAISIAREKEALEKTIKNEKRKVIEKDITREREKVRFNNQEIFKSINEEFDSNILEPFSVIELTFSEENFENISINELAEGANVSNLLKRINYRIYFPHNKKLIQFLSNNSLDGSQVLVPKIFERIYPISLIDEKQIDSDNNNQSVENNSNSESLHKSCPPLSDKSKWNTIPDGVPSDCLIGLHVTIDHDDKTLEILGRTLKHVTGNCYDVTKNIVFTINKNNKNWEEMWGLYENIFANLDIIYYGISRYKEGFNLSIIKE